MKMEAARSSETLVTNYQSTQGVSLKDLSFNLLGLYETVRG